MDWEPIIVIFCMMLTAMSPAIIASAICGIAFFCGWWMRLVEKIAIEHAKRPKY